MALNEEERRFFNRELSWIEFNARVLNEGLRDDVPLLERLNFLSIVSSNFDEFFQVRVASIKRAAALNPHEADSSGMTRLSLLNKISKRCHELTDLQYDALLNDVIPSLAKEGFVYVNRREYSQAQKNYIENYFNNEIFPLLTPLRTDGLEFPHIANMYLHAAFLMDKRKEIHKIDNAFSPASNTDLLAVVQIPASISQIVWFPERDGVKSFTLLEDIVSQYGAKLFPGYKIKESMLFKVARDADFAVDEESGEKFIEAMKDVLIKRQSSFAVRMVCNSSSQKILSILKQKLLLEDTDIYQVSEILNISALSDLASLDDMSEYLYPEWKCYYPVNLPKDGSYWNTLRQHDVLLNVPYESYDPVIKFISDASADKEVLAIKMTLYRTGNNSPIIQALKKAAVNGKSVTAFVELKARFDEKRNISWVEELENAGVTVIYGLANLKVHAKICLIIRKESDGIRRYTHLSTGNYNPRTAKLYQDFSIFTSSREIAFDATLFFNVISGYSIMQSMHMLSMAPVNLKSRLLELIDREIQQTTPENPGLIMAKINSLCHDEIIEALYKASCAGVKILLNVRGICTLVPGVPGMSENIKVCSVIGRNLEHSRVFYFKNSGAEEIYLSSADWMVRNLEKRIELMFPVLDKKTFASLKEIMLLYFRDNTHRHELRSDGLWDFVKPKPDETPVSVQEELHKKYQKLDEERKSQPKTEFTVRRKN